jgi:LmbE family N-acetylglucosaminyl deacetylase
LDAAFSYAWSYLHFPEQIIQEGLAPHRVREAYLWGTESPDVFVDISDFLDLKAEALAAHASQFRDPAGRAERVRRGAAEQGQAVGIPYAEGFRRIRFNLDSLTSLYLNW